jgi:FAD/FMN-containing dehydrogenase
VTGIHGTDAVAGAVIVPGDAAYDAAASIYNRQFRSQPALVIRPVDARDVARALTLAQVHGYDVAVKGGGHSIAGYSAIDGGILIDLAALDRVDRDPESRSVTVGGGVRAGALTTVTLEAGMVVPLGDSPDVGVAGLTLGGGIGWLSRKFGLTLDSLESAEVVLADGTIVTAGQDDHADLFWALRGGGGNLGIVTSLRFRLHRIGAIVGGLMALPATPRVLRGLLEDVADAPDELGAIALVTRLGPLPFVPPEAQGQLAALISVAWCGDVDEGRRQVDRLRTLARPIVDAVHVRPYADMYTLLDGAAPATITNSTATLLTDVERFDDRAIASVLAAFEAPANPDEPALTAVELRVTGGAVARVAPDATAFGHRHRDLVCSVVAAGFTPSTVDQYRAWVRSVVDGLAHLAMGAYVNFVGDANEAPLAAAYPPSTLHRLARIKANYDPDNVFHRNLNVVPRSSEEPNFRLG